MNIPCDCGRKIRLPRQKCCPKAVEIDYIEIPASAGTDEPGQPLAPENGANKNAVVKYVANGHIYIYTSEGIPVKLSNGSGGGGEVFSVNGKTGDVVLTTSDIQNTSDYQSGTQVLNAINTAIGELSIPSKTSQLVNDGATGTSTYVEATALADEISARENADNGLQGQIDALAASSDVTDIVGTYADLQAYDTSKLKDNDIIKVLQDEQHDNETTYYRWSTTTETFTLIGEEGPYYTKSAADQKFQDKLTAGTNISIDPLTETISASFDAETIFYANLNETGTSRHIYKDIAFITAASAQDIIDANDVGQVILRGTSTANPTAYSDSYLQNAFIMPHNNDFEFVFLDRDLRYEYTAGAATDTVFYYSTSEIQPKLTAGTNVTITGTTISATDTTYTAGAGLVLTGTVFSGDVNYRALNGASAPTTATEAKYVGQLYYDTTAGDMYYCSAITPQGTTPETYTYTWAQLGGGSSVTVVQTTGTSTADVMSQDASTKTIFGNGQTLTGSATAGTVVIDTANGKSYDANNSSVYILPKGGAPTSTSNYQKKSVYIGANSGQGSTVEAVGVGIEARAGQFCTAIGFKANASSSSVIIGRETQGSNTGVAVGNFAKALGNQSVAIGSGGNALYNTKAEANQSIAIGGVATSSYVGSVALGYYSSPSRAGEVNIGTPGQAYGYNSTSYRVLGGVHDAVDAHDAVPLGQLNARIVGSGTAAPTTSTVGSVGSLYAYVESGTGHLAICTDDTGGTYTWQTLV